MKRIINTGSIRFRFFVFIALLLLVLLLLLNLYPYISARDAVYQEKQSSMSSRGAALASALAVLDRPDEERVAEVLRLLDIQDYDRVIFVDGEGRVIYDSRGGGDDAHVQEDLRTALSSKTVFRSSLAGETFSSGYAVPVSAQGVITGAVYLHESDGERGRILHAMQIQIRTVSVIIAAAAFAMATVYSAGTLRRVQELSASMRIVAGGDYSYRMQTSGTDEVAELGNEFNELTERLEDTERQRRRFVSDASHELKTPLASIRLLSDSIVQNEGMDVGTMREFVTDIGNEADRLQRTTEKLLALSRLDDDIQIVPEPVDVRQVTLDALAVLRPLAEERSVTIRTALDDGCVVLATVDDMFHIVFNLMENAIKYNVPNGSVGVFLHIGGESVLFTVEDTGIGIPESETYNIFSRFYRIDKARSREAGGSGLGLSIVHDAVKAHGGSIAVGQNKPRGSRFIVSFPLYSIERT
ncbi:MAG: HAMP domain-containing sensor histidine kinase [Eubacteriales bacterium]|nr:HAMP domain-containing sensor histidine kinase [Eubacteriales bacterium]